MAAPPLTVFVGLVTEAAPAIKLPLGLPMSVQVPVNLLFRSRGQSRRWLPSVPRRSLRFGSERFKVGQQFHGLPGGLVAQLRACGRATTWRRLWRQVELRQSHGARG